MCLNPIEIRKPKTNSFVIASCRKCAECMQRRANEWALRGHFELKEHQENCFITLTYERNPVRLQKEHVQKFIKRLRKQIEPRKIKYFSCGEYGDQQLRPHYHIIIFGYDFNDKQYLRKSQSDLPIYESKQLTQLWSYGIAIIQEANANTIRYSARYSTKLKKHLPPHLKDFPEFNTMSQNLGVEPILRNIEVYLKTDQIYLDGFAYQIPDIILSKYAMRKYQNYERRDQFITEYKQQNRFQKFRTTQQLETAKRLSEKKKLHTRLRQL